MNKNDVFEQLRKIVCEIFEIEPNELSLNSNLRSTLELDSLSIVDFTMLVEDQFGIKIDGKSTQHFVTVNDVVNYILERKRIELELPKCFKDFINNIPEELRTENKYVYPNIPDRRKDFYDMWFGIEKDEKILYASLPDNGSYELFMFVTTSGIALYNEQHVIRAYWNQIYRVLYFFEDAEGNEGMNFYIYSNNGPVSTLDFSEYYLLNKSESLRRTGWPARTDRYTRVMEDFAELLTNIAQELYGL